MSDYEIQIDSSIKNQQILLDWYFSILTGFKCHEKTTNAFNAHFDWLITHQNLKLSRV